MNLDLAQNCWSKYNETDNYQPMALVYNFFDKQLFIRDAEIIHQICADKATSKPVERYQVLDFWGKNLVTTNGLEVHSFPILYICHILIPSGKDTEMYVGLAFQNQTLKWSYPNLCKK